ncbi:RNA polymerase sigma-70 region 2 [Dillenia turbinata]|uniref:RNA polymerase sigma-70 region 2 n=1 Tax=Dillenia turbinata TaxID=194707 RepID=A0AAN8VGQ5_9MAGN
MGFRLNLNWVFPLQSSFIAHSSSLKRSSSVRGRDDSLDSARVSFLYNVSGDNEALYNDPLKTYSCSSATQAAETENLSFEELKINVGKKPYGALQMPLKAKTEPHFRLLMETLDMLEETFADTDVIWLEKEILGQLKMLGALKLFQAYLSRSLKSPTVSNIFDISNTCIIESEAEGSVDAQRGKVIIHSGKRKERRLRRERALENAHKVSMLSLPSKNFSRGPRKASFSSAKQTSKSKKRRHVNARNEAQMATGVKEVMKLERIRETWEKEAGRAAGLSSWAEAAGLDEKALQKQLHFGWFCRDELLRCTRSLVIYITRIYRGLGVSFDDLLQAGNLGVLQGAERYDITKGYQFSTYVQYWIRKSMSILVAQHARGIRIPLTLSRAMGPIQKAQRAFHNAHKRYPEDDEIARSTGLSLARIRLARKCSRVVSSIDRKIGDSFNLKLLDIIPDMSIERPEETVIRQHMVEELHELLEQLDSRERHVMVLRYGLVDHRCRSLDEIGRLFGVSKEWIRKLERTAFAKLRNEEICKNLSHYLDS